MLSLSHFASATTISTPALLHFAPPASNLLAVEESWNSSGSLQSAMRPYLENENRLIIDLHSGNGSFNEVIQKFYGNQEVFWFVNLELPTIPGMTSLGESQLIAQVFLISFYRYDYPISTGSDAVNTPTIEPMSNPTVDTNAVPIDEPSTITLLGLSLMGFCGLITHRKQQAPIKLGLS
jgi:hypothetical protein